MSARELVQLQNGDVRVVDGGGIRRCRSNQGDYSVQLYWCNRRACIVSSETGADAVSTELGKHRDAELVDITMLLVYAFEPDERQLQYAIEIQETPLLSEVGED